jgi:hypothetical protein
MRHEFVRMLDRLAEDGVLEKDGEWYRVRGDAAESGAAPAAPPPTKKPRGATLLPKGWAPSAALREWALQQPGVSGAMLDAYASFFADYATSNGKKYADWDAAFRNCVRSDWGGIRKGHKPAAVAAQPIDW